MAQKKLVLHPYWIADFGRRFSASVKLIGCCVVLGLPLILTACNTVAGAGKDIQGAGEAVEAGADKVSETIDKHD